MRRIRYEVLKRTPLVDLGLGEGSDVHIGSNAVVMAVVLPEDEVFDPPSWVRHRIDTDGWWVAARTLPESGLNTHGQVDWKSVADNLAGALRAVVEEEEPGAASESAGRALDDYQIAVTEMSLAQHHGEEHGSE